MARVRILVVAGPDANSAWLETLAGGLEAEWFQVTVVGAVPEAVPAGVSYERWAWTGGWRAHRARARRLRPRLASADLVDFHGYHALATGLSAGIVPYPTVYTRTALPPAGGPARREQWFLGRVDAVVALGRAYALARPGVVTIPASDDVRRRDTRDRRELQRRLGIPDDGRPLVLVWAETAAPAPVAAAIRASLGSAHVRWWGASSHGAPSPEGVLRDWLRAADVVVLPVTPPAVSDHAIDHALEAGAAVVAARHPAWAGRVRCPVEALLVTPDDAVTWAMTVEAVVEDAGLRRDLADAAERWAGEQGLSGRVRVVQGVYAEVLTRRTGRCPVCPGSPAPVHGAVVSADGSENARESMGARVSP